MYCLQSSEEIGSVVDPSVINKNHISPRGLTTIVAALGAGDVARFERDLRDFERTGAQSSFLLGILAVAAGRRCKRNQRAVVYDIQTNVVGLAFDEVPQRADAI